LRDPVYAVRRSALEEAAGSARTLTPSLIAAALDDPAALQRERGAELAGVAGFGALARLALRDEVGRVRERALASVAAIDGEGASDLYLARLRGDPDPAVRRAAARALLTATPERPDALDELLGTLAEADPSVREPVARALLLAPPLPLADAIARALRRAAERASPLPAYLLRLSTLFQRVTGVDLGYAPGASRVEISAMALVVERWAERERRAGPSGISASRSGR